MKIKLIFIVALILLSACRPVKEEMSTIDPNYSVADITSFTVTLDCADAEITELKESFVKTYCSFLKQLITTTIQQQHPDWQLGDQKADLVIEATLDQLYGGNQALRFFLPLEAGRTMLTLHFSLYKQGLLIAERRIAELTRRIHFEDEKYTNEEAITEDSKIVAGYVSNYIDDPKGFDYQFNKSRNGYRPH